MVKLNYERDYYADLDLPSNADAADVKKQFKKLGRLRLLRRPRHRHTGNPFC